MQENSFDRGRHDAVLCGLPSTFPAAVVLLEPSGKIAFVSDLFAHLVQEKPEEIVGQVFTWYLSKDMPETEVVRLLSKDQAFDKQVELVLANDEKRIVRANAAKWLDPDGRMFRVIGLQDITDDKLARDKLQTELFGYQSCLDSTEAGTWEWNTQTGEIRINTHWAEMLGYTLDELEPTTFATWETLVHEDDLQSVVDGLTQYLKNEIDEYKVEFRMRHKDGHYLWIRTKGNVYKWTDDGEPLLVFGTHFLIDEERIAQDRERRTLRMLDKMAKVAGVGGWEVDVATGDTLWSNETKRIHGVDPDYIPSVEEGINFYAPEARPVISAAVEAGMNTGESWDLELPFIRATGERIWVRAMGEVEFENDTPVRIVGAFQDITDRVQANSELIAAKEWTTLAAEKGRVGLWSLDAVTGQLQWDAQMTAHFGLQETEKLDSMAQWLNILPRNMQRQLKESVRKSLFLVDELDQELSFTTIDGTAKVLKLVGAPHLGADGVLDRLQGACFDLTEQRQMLAKLEEEAEKLSVTLSSIGDGVITTDADGVISWMNAEAEQISGWTLDEVIGRPSTEVLKITNQITGAEVPNPIATCIRERQKVLLERDTMLCRKDGELVSIDDAASPIVTSGKQIMGAVMVFRDTTEQRELSRAVEHRASYDLLTGLLNRTSFLDALTKCLGTPLQKNGGYLLAIDLDHFKRINDSLGHMAGDAVLKRLADILRDACPDDAIIARIGGDEFAIFLRVKTLDNAKDIADAICQRVAEGAVLRRKGDSTFQTGTSIGLVPLADLDIDSAEAMRFADIAAYSAKNLGRGQVCVWNADDHSMQTMSRQTTLIKKIEQAISDSSWIVQEQCIQDLESLGDQDAFVELLIRLPDENGGMVPPSDFLPAAERYGLMQPIDLWMCDYALNHIQKDKAKGGKKIVSVNVSLSSISNRKFQEDMINLISAMPKKVREYLCIEVTEAAILKDYEDTKQFLSDVRSHSVKVAIDDFGAGQTSFRHFENLPADYLKIDGSFIQGMNNPVQAACIDCFIRMAKVANLTTIAEHVEHESQLDDLRALNIDLVQGFLLGRPR